MYTTPVGSMPCGMYAKMYRFSGSREPSKHFVT